MLYNKTYQISDSADWVVMVHGAGGSSAIWYKQIKEYKQHFNVLLLDLRGHGKSQQKTLRQKLSYTFEDLSRDILEVLDHHKIQQAHFVGISLGTILIRTLAEHNPDRVKSMVLGGAITRLNIRSRFCVWLGNSLKRVMPYMWLYRFFAWIIMPRKRHGESRNLFIGEAKRLASKEVLRWFELTHYVNPLLRYFSEKELAIPTLYVMGEEDHMFLGPVKEMVKRHGHSYLHVIDKCGHVVNVEKPAIFNDVTVDWMLSPTQNKQTAA